jgi:hypothetical protein
MHVYVLAIPLPLVLEPAAAPERVRTSPPRDAPRRPVDAPTGAAA